MTRRLYPSRRKRGRHRAVDAAVGNSPRERQRASLHLATGKRGPRSLQTPFRPLPQLRCNEMEFPEMALTKRSLVTSGAVHV
jgi:hypothetical protein